MEYEIRFPDPNQAEDDGLVAVGGELSPEYLLSAYAQGIFPWFNEGEPILWWSPNPRMILYPSKFKRSASLQQKLRNKSFAVRFDTCFREVMQHCAGVERRNQSGTWITKDMIGAYHQLHEMGFAHSVETYQKGKLVGGLYGISLGKIFFGESMFYLVPDASKIALSALCDRLIERDFHFIDVQQSTRHLRSLGGEDVPRDEFLKQLAEALKFSPERGRWTV